MSTYLRNDRIVREAERQKITSISRSQAFQLERQNRFPKRIKLGSRSVGWRLSELQKWVSKVAEQGSIEEL
ncbi:AlpA family phage regulatory protein [Parashewanella spongiae]|uniref:AlpA family phage regulatory protein n=1 Tax=Parashewanella spongiae TaxID=342950 RepID=A0A3A6TII4_9GAMM|nr:AlpA family phage regulatory protein [Parashewanella spongiae]MCL1078800.1 AlpA family transcriptional regulator [Parashewanella spongiae]RJY11946.1 AlpA family phage regulatory protein [Parashewanella spongiae]